MFLSMNIYRVGDSMTNNLNDYNDKHDVQKFDWGEVVWLHEPRIY